MYVSFESYGLSVTSLKAQVCGASIREEEQADRAVCLIRYHKWLARFISGDEYYKRRASFQGYFSSHTQSSGTCETYDWIK